MPIADEVYQEQLTCRVVQFGDGDVHIGIVMAHDSNRAYGLTFRSGPSGEVGRESEFAKFGKITGMPSPVILAFPSTESLDAVLRVLGELRALMVSQEVEQVQPEGAVKQPDQINSGHTP